MKAKLQPEIDRLCGEIFRLSRWIVKTEDPELIVIYEEMIRVREIQLQQLN